MKLQTLLISIASVVVSASAAASGGINGHKGSDGFVSVYELSNNELSDSADIIGNKDSLAYFADRIGIDADIKLGEKNAEQQKLIDFIDRHHSENKKAKLFVTVNGGDSLFDTQPSFKIQGKAFNLFGKLSRAMARDEFSEVELTPEMTMFSKDMETHGELIRGFRMFNEALFKIWNSFKEEKSLNTINDKFFITELSALNFLKGETKNEGEIIFAESNALISIGKKIGFDSYSYDFATKVFGDFLLALSEKIDVVVFIPSGFSTAITPKFARRSIELDNIFTFNKRIASGSAGVCFTSEESCQVSTTNCNSHGVCSKLKEGCWSCLCSATFNKTTQSTTHWAGADCAKRNVSAQANLFLWTSIFLVALLVGGIKLLASVGSQPLPGVLDSK